MRMLNLANNMQAQGSGGIARLPGADFQTLAALYDGSLPASQSYSRLSNAWNSETGLIAPHNLTVNTPFAGTVDGSTGTPPTGYTFPVGSGTNARVSSSVFAGEFALSQTATAQRPAISRSTGVTYPVGTVFTLGLYVESFSGVTALTDIVQAAGVVADIVSAPAISVGWNYLVLRVTTASAISARYGLGPVIPATGSLIFSRPFCVLDDATITGVGYTENTSTTAAVYMPRYQTGRQGQAILIEGASTNKCTAWSVPRADSLGAELIVTAADRDFTSDTLFWSKGAGVTIPGNGFAVFSGVADGLGLFRNANALTDGKFYTVTFTTSGLTGGIKVRAGSAYSAPVTTNAVQTVTIQAAASATMYVGFYANGVTTGNITNVSVKEAIDYVGTKAYHNGTAFQNPIPSMTLSGDPAAVLSIVTDQTAIDNAIALNPTDGSMVALQAAKANGYKVYMLDNSAGSVAADVSVTGVTGNTNAHSITGLARKISGASGYQTSLLNTQGIVLVTSTNWILTKSENIIPSSASRVYAIRAGAGVVGHFLLPSLEESAYATSPILCQGVATTRAAGAASGTSAGVIAATSSSINIWFKPTAVATGKAQTAWSSWTDASNYTALFSNGVIFYIEKRKAGVSEYVTVPIAAVGGSWYLCSIIFNADGTMGLMVNGTADGKTSGAFPTGLGAERVSHPINLLSGWTNTSATIDSANGFTTTAVNGFIGRANMFLTNKFCLVSLTSGSASVGAIRVGSGSGAYFLTGLGSAAFMPTVSNTLLVGNASAAVMTNVDVSVNELHNTTTATVPVIAATYKVGAFADTATGTLQADGLIDNERYFGRVLTLAEHTTYYNRGR